MLKFLMQKPSSSPKIHFDWTINLGHVISATVVLTTMLFAFTNLKEAQSLDRQRAELKYAELDRRWDNQKTKDLEQNDHMMQIYRDFQALLKDMKDEIRLDIRDLRTDVQRAGSGKITR